MKLSKHTVYLLKMFFIIFILSATLFVLNFEFHLLNLKVENFTSERKYYFIEHQYAPFNYIDSKIKIFYIYYIPTYFCLTLFHVFLYNYLWNLNRFRKRWLKLMIYIVGMYFGGFMLYIFNQNLYNVHVTVSFDDFIIFLFFIFFDYRRNVIFFLLISWLVTIILKKPEIERI